MDGQTLITEVQAHANQAVANTSQRFFKTGKGEYGEADKFYGIRNPILRALAKKYHNLPTEEVLLLLADEYHEVRLLAVFILVNQYQKSTDIAFKTTIADLYIQHSKQVNSWDLVDSSAYKILGPHLYHCNNMDCEVLYQFAHSKNLWQRRIAIITTLYFIKQQHFQVTIELCTLLLRDKEDLIHKACGWMLREAAKYNKALVVAFLSQYKDHMPRTMLRYAIEKFDKDERQHFMRRASG